MAALIDLLQNDISNINKVDGDVLKKITKTILVILSLKPIKMKQNRTITQRSLVSKT